MKQLSKERCEQLAALEGDHTVGAMNPAKCVRLLQCGRKACSYVLTEDEREWKKIEGGPMPGQRAVCPKCGNDDFFTLNPSGQKMTRTESQMYQDGIDPQQIEPSPRMGEKMRAQLHAVKKRILPPEEEPQGWVDPNMLVQAGATYREMTTGRIMKLVSVNMAENAVILKPAGNTWQGTSQELAEQFAFVAPWGEQAEQTPPFDLLVTRLRVKFGDAEVTRILQELEEKSESYQGKTKDLSVAHDDEYDGG